MRSEGKIIAEMGFFRGSNVLSWFFLYTSISGVGTDRRPKLFRPKKWRQEASSTRFQRNRGFCSHAKIQSVGGDFAAGGDFEAGGDFAAGTNVTFQKRDHTQHNFVVVG